MRAILDLIFPRRCPSCDEPAAWLCEPCRARVVWITTCCARCGLPSPVATPTCARCERLRPAFSDARSAAVYAGPARDAVLAYKLGGERRAARDLAAAMVAVASPADLVTAVPSSRRAVAARGFNPAEDLARNVARGLGLPHARVLRKVRETADQAGLSRIQRARNLEGAFVAGTLVTGRVLLVDDIVTTGATADACARALRSAGASRIAVLTFATAV